MSDIQTQWMAVRMDIHGTNYLVKDGMDEAGATEHIKSILAPHRKVHGQDYSTYSYTPDTRAGLIERLGLKL